MGRSFEQTHFQKRYSDTQHKHEKIIIINHQENAKENKKQDITSHLEQPLSKDKKEQVWTRI